MGSTNDYINVCPTTLLSTVSTLHVWETENSREPSTTTTTTTSRRLSEENTTDVRRLSRVNSTDARLRLSGEDSTDDLILSDSDDVRGSAPTKLKSTYTDVSPLKLLHLRLSHLGERNIKRAF